MHPIIMAWHHHGMGFNKRAKKTQLLVALPKLCLLSEQCKMLPKIGKATNKEKFLLLLCFFYCIWMAIMAYRFEWRSRPNETREQSSVFSYYRHCHCHHQPCTYFVASGSQRKYKNVGTLCRETSKDVHKNKKNRWLLA